MKKIQDAMKARLQLPENEDIAKNMNLNSSDSCSFGDISQARPIFEMPNKMLPHGLSSSTTNIDWANLIFPNGTPILSDVNMNTQPTPGMPSPTVFFDGNDTNAITATSANNVTINQLWLADLVSQTVEFGWWTWGGYAPYLFAYSTNSGYKNAQVPFTSASGTPFPANQPGNYHQTLSLYYIVASKGPGDSFCGGDPAGCYALEVATTLLGVRTSDFWLVGWYSKSNYVYQNFTNFETGLEIHSGGVSEPAFGTIYNVGTNLTQDSEQDFNLQSFGQVPGVSNTWSPSFTLVNTNFPASMAFGGTYN